MRRISGRLVVCWIERLFLPINIPAGNVGDAFLQFLPCRSGVAANTPVRSTELRTDLPPDRADTGITTYAAATACSISTDDWYPAWHLFHKSAAGEGERQAKLAFIRNALSSVNDGARTMLATRKQDPGRCLIVTYEQMDSQCWSRTTHGCRSGAGTAMAWVQPAQLGFA